MTFRDTTISAFSMMLSVFLLGNAAHGQAPAVAKQDDDLKILNVATGYEVNVFAADPAIKKPIQIQFDNRGRLWVVSSESYPQVVPGAEPTDKVFILEDTDGDGRADKSTLFADKLLIPTGIEVGSDGIYVGQSTELVMLKDTDGDGKADQNRPVLSGFGTEDTHHLIHTFRWSPDGWLCFGQSIYIHSHIETPWGVKRLNGGGFWMMRPESQRLKVFVHGMVNPWGLAFDRHGHAFGVDNDEFGSIKYFFAGAKYHHTPNEPLVLDAIVKGKPKYCGAEIVGDQHMPELQGELVTCDFRAHRVARFKLVDDGSGFQAVEQPTLIDSANVAFRPIDVKLGPDGALYVCDWFNQIINHGEVDFRDPRRDRTQGRIYRIKAKNRELRKPIDFTKCSVDELLELGLSENLYDQNLARRTLLEREPLDAVKQRALEWARTPRTDLQQLNAIWLLNTLGVMDEEVLLRCLRAKDGNVRSAAIRIAAQHWLTKKPISFWKEWINDSFPRVRLETVRLLAEIGNRDAVALASQSLDQPMDRFIEYALKLTARETADQWSQGIAQGIDLNNQGEVKRWAFLLLALDDGRAADGLMAIWSASTLPEELRSQVLSAISKHGSPVHLRSVADKILAADSTARRERKLTVLNSMIEASRSRNVRPAGELSALWQTIVKSADAEIRVRACQLAGTWKLGSVETQLADIVRKGSLLPERVEALRAMIELASPASKTLLLESIDQTNAPAELSQIAWQGLARLDAAQCMDRLADRSANKKLSASRQEVSAVLQAKNCLDELGGRLAKGSIKPDFADALLSKLSQQGSADPALLAALLKASGKPDAPKLSPEQKQQLLTEITRRGNADHGAQIYERTQLACVKCHIIAGKGGKIGPELTSIGTSAPLDYLLESILEPNAKVKENFHSVVLELDTGEIKTGIPVSKTNDRWEIRDENDKVLAIPARSVVSSKIGTSLMPANIVTQLSRDELIDLVQYLSELGKPGKYGSTNELTIRDWKLLGPLVAEQTEMVSGPAIANEALPAGVKWEPSLTLNIGIVHLVELARRPEWKTLFASFEVEGAPNEKCPLVIEPAIAKVYIDGQLVTPKSVQGNELRFELVWKEGQADAAGNGLSKRRVTIELDLPKKPNMLRARLYPSKTAKITPVKNGT